MMTKEEMIFKANLEEHGCGYYSICIDHECFCDMMYDEFDIMTWLNMKEVFEEAIHGYYEDDYDDYYEDWDE